MPKWKDSLNKISGKSEKEREAAFEAAMIAALTKDTKNADAKAFLDFLRSAKARTSFEKQGFTVLAKSASST
jgi:ABC-type molybdate transport system substrate-binding protein